MQRYGVIPREQGTQVTGVNGLETWITFMNKISGSGKSKVKSANCDILTNVYRYRIYSHRITDEVSVIFEVKSQRNNEGDL
jgi:hypothetical protein